MQHSFNTNLAEEYGILEAILINHMWFWIEKNRVNDVNYFDGNYWTFNSTRAFNELFPYVSEKQIKYALKHLREEEIIQIGNYNKNALDRTLWYAFTEKGKAIVSNCPMDRTKENNVHETKENNPLSQIVRPIPYINNTDINTDIKLNKEKKNISKDIFLEKKKFGEFENVFLTDEQYQKLKDKFYDVDERIETLSAYIASKGVKYKNHYATILTWARKENKTNTPKRETPVYIDVTDDPHFGE